MIASPPADERGPRRARAAADVITPTGRPHSSAPARTPLEVHRRRRKPRAPAAALVRALCAEIDAYEALGTFETEYELHLHELGRHKVVHAWEARPGSGERGPDGRMAGEFTLDEALVDSFRFNLSRQIVGEVRGQEMALASRSPLPELADDLTRQVEPEGVDECLIEGENSPAMRPSVSALAGTGAGLPRIGRPLWRPSSWRCSSYSVSNVPSASYASILGAPMPGRGSSSRRPGLRRRRWTCRARTAARRNEATVGVIMSRCARKPVEGHAHQPVATNHHRWSRCDPRCGGETGTTVETEMEPRLSLRERAGVDLAARREEHQEVDQASSSESATDGPSISEPSIRLEQDVVVSGDDDVLHAGVIEQEAAGVPAGRGSQRPRARGAR